MIQNTVAAAFADYPITAVSMPGTGELLLILAIVLVLFGGAKIPEIARNLGKGIREFKKSLEGRDGDRNSDPEKRG